MKIKTFSVLVAASLALSSVVIAGPSKTYQVTGPILEMNDTMIAVQKGKERWEIARDASTKADGELKVGNKVTITYSMTATKVEDKGVAKQDSKASASPSPTASATPKK